MTFYRLLLREIGVPLILALLLVSQLLIVMQLLQLNEVLFGSGFEPLGVLRIAGYLFPHFGVIAVPLAFLLAIMLGLGRLSEDNEIVALAALGRSPFMLYVIPLLLSAVLGGVVGFFVFKAEPWGLRGVHRQLNELIKRNVAGDVIPGTFSEDIPGFTLFIDGADEARGEWRHVLVQDSSEEGAPLLLLAKTGSVQSEGADAILRLDLKDGELHRAGKDDAYTHGRFESATVALGVSDFLRRNNRFIRPAGEMSSAELLRAAAQARAAGLETQARALMTAYHGRLAALLTCLVFGLIAVPLAMSGRGARGRSFVATVFAFAAYYFFQTIAAGQAETGRVSPLLAAWAPNIVGVVVAAVMAWRLGTGRHLGAHR